jgi:hypothetical protein
MIRDGRGVTRQRWIDLIIFLVYLGIALGITWPLAANLDSHFPGDSNDSLHHYWNGWWVQRALNAGQSPSWTPYLHYPDGLSLVSHDFAWFNIGIWLIVEPLLGGLVAYNWGILISLALCGSAAFALASELTGDVRAAFLAGLLYQAWPFRLHQLDRPNLASTQWIPLFLLFLVRSIDRGKWWSGVLAGVFLAVTGYTRWQQLIPAVMMGGVYFLCTVPGRLASWRRWGPALLLASVVATMALAPPALLLLRQQQSDPAELLRPDEEATMQTDVLAYLTPSRFHWLLRSFTQRAYARYYPDRSEPRRYPAYIGMTALGLALLGAWKTRRPSLPWAAMALTLILLALGPVLRVNGQLYPALPMPYRLAARVQLVRLLRLPDRFNLFLALPIAVLAGYGITYLLGTIQRHRPVSVWVISIVLAVAFLVEYAVVPIPLSHPEVSAYYRQLAEDQTESALLNLPLDQKASKRYMFAQIEHQHPIVQGHVSRFPQGAFDYMNSQAWIRALGDGGSLPPTHSDVSRQLETLARDGVRYIVVHKKLNPNRIQHWRHYFLIAPRFEDDRIIVYPTAPMARRDFVLAEGLTPGMGIITATLSTECLGPGQPLGVDVGWGATVPVEQDLDVRLTLVPGAGTAELEQTFPLSDDWPTNDWPANTVARGYYRVGIPSSLPGDVYSVSLNVVDPASGVAQGQEAFLGPVTVSKDRCAAFTPSASTSVNALFGSELRLIGYQAGGAEDRDPSQELTITLLWRSERLMHTDYKVSVELLDPDDGRRLARDDAMPLRWAYRTSYWSKGELVTDAIPLSLENVPAGLYNVAVTVYDPGTGERLPVTDSNGQLQPNGQILLPAQDAASLERLEVEVGVPEEPRDLAALKIPHPFQREMIPQLRLLGYDLKHAALLAGDSVAIQLFWEALGSMSQDYKLRLALVDDEGVAYHQQDFSVVSIDYPTNEWRPGDVLEEWYTLPTAEHMPSGDVALRLSLVEEGGGLVLASPVEVVTVWVQGAEPSFEMPHDIDQRHVVNLEDKVTLLGYDVPPLVQAGETMALTLYWRAQREMDTSYKVFVHLYDGEGEILTQRDRMPGLGARPTSAWEKGEILADRYFVPIGSDVPAGRYQLTVGLYDPQTGERLATFGSGGERLAQDRILLERVEVKP